MRENWKIVMQFSSGSVYGKSDVFFLQIPIILNFKFTIFRNLFSPQFTVTAKMKKKSSGSAISIIGGVDALVVIFK